MANELKLMVETELPVMFKCDDTNALAKGALLELTESMTVVINSGQGVPIAGVAAAEKIANDGVTMIPVYMGGIFKAIAGAAVAIGVALMADATVNQVETSTGLTVGAAQLGYSLEAPSGVGQSFLMRLNPGGSGATA